MFSHGPAFMLRRWRFIRSLAALTLLVALSANCLASEPRASGTSSAETQERFASRLSQFIAHLGQVPDGPPGFAVVVVDGARTAFERAYGVRNAETGDRLTLDTPIYNASITKAYTGLLASVMDADGVLGLNASLRDVWPAITLPQGLDPSSITAARLLSHSSGMSAGGLIYRSVISGEISASEVPIHLARFAVPEARGFAYSNMGPFVYSAMLEHRTGLPWRVLMARHVFQPAGLSHTGISIADFRPGTVARGHVRMAEGWRAIPFKPDAVMNAAGGMYSSARDAARFLQAFVTDGRSIADRIPAKVLKRTWVRFADQDREALGIHRDGYGLGWDLGTYDGLRTVSRSGGYTGYRGTILFVPELKLGVVILVVGDAGGNALITAILGQSIDYWRQQPDAEHQSRRRLSEYARLITDERKRSALAAPRPTLVLDPALRASIIGKYGHERLGKITIERYGDDDMLLLRAGVWSGQLRYVGKDEFELIERGVGIAEPFWVIRSTSGSVRAVVLDDDQFQRDH